MYNQMRLIPEIQGWFNIENLQYQQTKEEKPFDLLNQSRKTI